MDRLEVSAAEARERATLAQDQYEDVQELSGGGEEDRSGLAAAHQQAAAELSQSAERVKVLRTAERESARDLAARRARAETLAEAARRGVDASGALLADPARFGGVIGSFAARLRVAEGFEVAIAAALGAAAEAVAVAGLDAAADILAALRRDDAGGASLVITQATLSTTPAVPVLPTPSAPHGSGPIPANELVRAPDGLAEAAAELLCDVVVTADLEQAR